MKSAPCLLLTVLLALGGLPLQAAELNVASPASSEAKFDPMIDDLPLAPGLTPKPEEETIFVTPRVGRIAESSAVGAVDIDEVYRFYLRTLPQLGWQKIDNRSYRRGGEILRIKAHADGKTTAVHFSIRPK